ncbi:MAG: PilZ domain-containing protein [Desulfamplus sp.]|nr:PilZ domain-containing protein [Desulfamplus sp.]
MIKGYIDDRNNTLFICPHCGFQKNFNALPFKNKKNLAIKCKCGQSTEMKIEFRQYFRKRVGLPGTCILDKHQTRCDIIIKDISLGGVGIEFVFVHKKHINQIEVGDTIFIEFKLDDTKNNNITKKCVVRIKIDNTIGAEFIDEQHNKTIGFYMMN